MCFKALFLVGLLLLLVTNSQVKAADLITTSTRPLETSNEFIKVNINGECEIYVKTYNMDKYNEYGKYNKYPLLFIRGITQSMHIWDSFFDLLMQYNEMKSYPMIFIDLCGFGNSQVFNHTLKQFDISSLTKDIVRILKVKNIERAIWNGYSLGGIISIYASIYHSTYVDKMSLYSTGPYVPSSIVTSLIPLIMEYDNGVTRNMGWYNIPYFNYQLFVNLGYITQEQANYLYGDLYRVSAPALQRTAIGVPDMRNNTIKKEAMIVYGTQDITFIEETQNALKNMFVNNNIYQYFEYNNFGHEVLLSKTNEIVNHFVDWLL